MLNKSDLSKIKGVVKGEIKNALKPVDKRLDKIEKGVRKNYENLNMVIGFLIVIIWL